MTEVPSWSWFIWVEVLSLGGLVGWIIDFVVAQGRAPGGVLASMLAGFLGAFLGQWLLGEIIPWTLFGVSWIMVIPMAALCSLIYVLLTRLFRFY
jgi:uncharacterized membrane protein YeaQ/YmgE (transglycosylase-associated protein family)